MSVSLSASDFVNKHQPTVLKRVITEYHAKDGDWKADDSIRVVCRFRPPNSNEKAYSRRNRIPDKPPRFESQHTIILSRSEAKNKQNLSTSRQKPFTCTLDNILNPETTQKQVFYLVGQPMILSCLQGFNSTIFAYGQSGSGKTWTMFGPEDSSDVNTIHQFGLIPRCFIYLFQKLNSNNNQNNKVTMQLLQIYKRELLDLLNTKSRAKLVIKTDFRNDSVFVQNLTSIQVQSVEEAFACLTEAQSNRIVASHALNAVSSRSHMLVMVSIVQTFNDGSIKRSKLNFGDLAGSEDLTKALGKNPDPQRRQEAIAINSSLSALTTAISYLSKGKKPGYRDSPLTHILKDSLGGNSKTIMFVACSPHIYNRNETIRALRFAQTAKKVKNKAKKNEDLSVHALKKKIKQLQQNVQSLQAQLIQQKGMQRLVSRMTKRNLSFAGASGSRSPSIALSPRKKPKPAPIPPIKELTNEPSLSSAISSDLIFSDDDHDNEDLEDLNYIHQIGELQNKLDKALQSNNILNEEISNKNNELEQSNNKIAELLSLNLSNTSRSDSDQPLKIEQQESIALRDEKMLKYLMELSKKAEGARKDITDIKKTVGDKKSNEILNSYNTEIAHELEEKYNSKLDELQRKHDLKIRELKKQLEGISNTHNDKQLLKKERKKKKKEGIRLCLFCFE